MPSKPSRRSFVPQARLARSLRTRVVYKFFARWRGSHASHAISWRGARCPQCKKNKWLSSKSPRADGWRSRWLSTPRKACCRDEELHDQIEGFAGPKHQLPDARLHELFEQRALKHPDTIAGVCGDKQWTYGELNERANRLGHALLAHGLDTQKEQVVAVVTERNLDWLASVLAIFKVGGVYLPIEPHFPADRIARMLTRAECKFALSETGQRYLAR